MSNNSQSRKWHMVINNPLEYGMSHESIIRLLMLFSPEYFCLSDEISSTGTFHTHGFIYSPAPIRFNTLKTRFPVAHIEKAYGSVLDNKNYILKTGKWADTDKAETTVQGSFYEYGHMPEEKEEKNPLQYALIQDIYTGKRTAEIVTETPNLAFKVKEIELLRKTLLSERYSKEFRELDISYLYGTNSTDITRSIYQKYPPVDICRITNYRTGKGAIFDGYTGQDILIFEKFASQIPIEEMLLYLDCFPIMLPARYSDKVACFTKVFLTANVPPDTQYYDIRKNKPDMWNMFFNRINHIQEFLPDGTIKIVL